MNMQKKGIFLQLIFAVSKWSWNFLQVDGKFSAIGICSSRENNPFIVSYLIVKCHAYFVVFVSNQQNQLLYRKDLLQSILFPFQPNFWTPMEEEEEEEGFK